MVRTNWRVELRRGDHWRYLTNNGYLSRHIRSVASGIVHYLDCEGRMQTCSVETLKRWIGKRSELWSADDWTGRDKDGYSVLASTQEECSQ